MTFGRILPATIDNTYRGSRAAVWLLVPVVVLKTGVALRGIVDGRSMAQSSDRIPLDSFGGTGADAAVTLVALWGLSQLAFSVFGILALTRYRALIPFTFLLLLLEHLARWWILLVMPIARTGPSPGDYVNVLLLAVLLGGLALSLRRFEAAASPSGLPPEAR